MATIIVFSALFKNAYILICDEPTAFVDLSAEQSIYGILNEYGKQHAVAATKGERLKAILDRAGIVYSLPCGGAGRC